MLLLPRPPKKLTMATPATLTHRPIQRLLRRLLRPMPPLLLMILPPAQMLFLNARGARVLEGREVDRVELHELFGDGDDIGDEAVEQVEGHAFTHHDAEDLGGGAGGWEGVVCWLGLLTCSAWECKEKEKEGARTRDDILFHPQQSAHALLLHVAVGPLEVLREMKCHDRQAGIVLGARLALLAVLGCLRAFIDVLSPLAMDIAHTNVPPGLLERIAQQPRVREAVLHDGTEAFEAEVDEVVVLRDDVRAGSREVESEGLLGAAEIVQLEDEVPGQVGFVAPDYPADAGVDEPELVAGCIDGFDAGELEVPIVMAD